MSARPVVHIISRQIGSAYPLAEFSEVLSHHGFDVKNFVFEPSKKVFEVKGLSAQLINDFQSYSSSISGNPAFIFTGTSFSGDDDSKFWSFARLIGAKSFAWLDHAVNLEHRFVNFRDKSKMPDFVFVTDRGTLNEVSNKNLSAEVLCVGSPYIEALIKQIDRKLAERNLVYFMTEPAGDNENYHIQRETLQYRRDHGFDDIDALLVAKTLVSNLSKKTGTQWKLKVKLHPVDSATRVQECMRHLGEGEVEISKESKERCFSRAGLIVGTRSMALFESAQVGIPTLSLQPNRKTPSPLIDDLKNLRIETGYPQPEAVLKLIEGASSEKLNLFDEDRFLKLFELSSKK